MPTDPTSFLIYGANGYTGALAAGLAAARGLKAILGGRSREKLEPLGRRLGLPVRAFALDDAAAVRAGLAGVGAVLHCAGPFSATSRPMVDACLEARAHYLDITGELAVLDAVLDRAAEARARGVALLPGVGFDVVPSDCLAMLLHRKLPSATALELAFAPGGRSSGGTMKSAVEALPRGTLIRRGGKLVQAPSGLSREVPFAHRTLRALAISWGDLASAFRSTGIPDLTVYMAAHASMVAFSRLLPLLAPITSRPSVQRFLQRQIERRVTGPTPEQRARTRVHLWGRATGPGGTAAEAVLETPEGYTFTADAALECTLRALAGKVPPGAWTPGQAFGPDFVLSLGGTSLAWR